MMIRPFPVLIPALLHSVSTLRKRCVFKSFTPVLKKSGRFVTHLGKIVFADAVAPRSDYEIGGQAFRRPQQANCPPVANIHGSPPPPRRLPYNFGHCPFRLDFPLLVDSGKRR